MSAPGPRRVPALAPLALLVAWSALWNVIGVFTFGYGPLTVACMTGIGLLCAFATPLARRLGARGRLPPAVLSALLAAVTVAGLVSHGAILARAAGSGRMVDIGQNTLMAERQLFALGRNPYATPCQSRSVGGAPHVTGQGGETRMFGVRYRYGYPYFPAMFLSYEPFRHLAPGLESIRFGNVVFLLLALAGMLWLSARVASPRSATLAGLLAVAALTSVWGLGHDLMRAGVTDLVIAVYLLYGFVALTYGRSVLAGVLFGLALAAKLMPAALLVPILVAWFARRPAGRWRAGAAFAATVALVVVPFVVWDPGAFLSATVLYYLSFHAPGDDSSLWFVLPAALRTPFLIAGAAVVLGILVAGLRRVERVADLVALLFLAQLALVAFSPMIHLNYLWAVAPLGCVVLGTRIAEASTSAPEHATP